jgi:molecular chaperone GrpE (heat shock protein)
VLPQIGAGERETRSPGPHQQYSAVDLSKLLSHLVEVVDSLWKANLRWQKAEPSEQVGSLKHLGRNLDSGLAALHAAGFEVKDHTEERYAEGSRVEVLAFQPVDGMRHPTIIETLKPTIYFMERLIRPGQVIVGKPANSGDQA